jgi:phosphoribosylformylglycinamidine synthase PurS subunit
MSAEILARRFRFAVNILPMDSALDPRGRALERRLLRHGLTGISQVRLGRRVELAVDAPDEAAARAHADRLARELLCNPLTEQYAIEALGALSAARRGHGG